MSKINRLLGASALAAIGLVATGSASAAVSTQLYGGGSTLIGPYLVQAQNCYGEPAPLVNKGSALNNPTLTNTTPFNYVGSTKYPAQNCATTHIDTTLQMNYIGAGSGAGIAGLYSHATGPFWGDTVPGTDPSFFPSVDFAASDAGLASGDVTIYNTGGTEGSGATAVTVAAFNTAPTAGQYPNPLQSYGAMIQFPLIIAPVAIAYDPVYKKVLGADGHTVTSYKFFIKHARTDGSGGLYLDEATLCKIFNGQITNWNDKALKLLNGNNSLADPSDPDKASFSVPMEIVGRSDSSGTTSIFTRHLAAECPLVITGNGYPDGSKTLPSTLINTGSTPTPGKFTVQSGSSGVANYVAFTTAPTVVGDANAVKQGRIGYLGPDFVLPAVTTTGANTFGLNSASLLRTDPATLTTYVIPPTGAKATLAFGASFLPPQSDSLGNYNGATGGKLRSNPADWVEPIFKTSPLAIPANIKAYPIVGTTDYIGYTCYANGTVAQKMNFFLQYYVTNGVTGDATNGLIAKAGFAPMPNAWKNAIYRSFLKPNASTQALNLYIQRAGGGQPSGTGSQCHAVSPGA